METQTKVQGTRMEPAGVVAEIGCLCHRPELGVFGSCVPPRSGLVARPVSESERNRGGESFEGSTDLRRQDRSDLVIEFCESSKLAHYGEPAPE